MPKTRTNSKIDTRAARSRLPARREPYWTGLDVGNAIGYRSGAKGGTWIARYWDPAAGKRSFEALGAADDFRDADGISVFDWRQAQQRARAFFDRRAKEIVGDVKGHAGPYTVATALCDYFAARERRGSKGVKADRHAALARIVPELGAIEVDKLTSRRIRDWHASLAESPKLVRTKRGATERATKAHDADDQDAVRARRATANRVLTVLKAALNHAFHEGNAVADESWRKVKPFREADAAIVRFLRAAECVQLVKACESAFRDLVCGALVTGARYGELSRMRVEDFSPESGIITVRLSKAGKRRHVALTDEGRALFRALAAGRNPRDLIFQRSDGGPWRASQQQRPLDEASARAGIIPATTFHILRHSYATALATKGVPLGVIAAQLGHADTRMTERHYAHLAPSYVAETVRAALPALGLVEQAHFVPDATADPNKDC